VPGDGFMNVRRTEALWKEFKAPESLVFKNDWVDRPSVGIPYLYVNLGYLLASVQRSQGKALEAAATMHRATAVARAAHLDSQVVLDDTSQIPLLPGADTAIGRTKVPVTKAPTKKTP